MRANGNFDKVEASQGGTSHRLEPGGYACLIHEVIDGTEEESPYIGLVLNVLDRKTNTMMFTQDLADPGQWWRHTYRYYVSNWNEPGVNWSKYKALVEAVESTEQNKGFAYVDMDGGEQQLKGKWLGCVFRRYLYVPKRGKHAGEQSEGIELAYVCTAKDALAGEFPDRYAQTRDGRPDDLKGTPYPPVQSVPPVPSAPTAQPVELADDDIPF